MSHTSVGSSNTRKSIPGTTQQAHHTPKVAIPLPPEATIRTIREIIGKSYDPEIDLVALFKALNQLLVAVGDYPLLKFNLVQCLIVFSQDDRDF
jgi:hypothetical protein